MALQGTIVAAVDALRSDVIAALQELVRIPSPTGEEAAAQQAMAQLMHDQELEVDVWEPDEGALAPYAESVTIGNGFAGRPNVVGLLRGRGGGRSLILNGHIDTVEIGDRGAWSHEPLSASVISGLLHGR